MFRFIRMAVVDTPRPARWQTSWAESAVFSAGNPQGLIGSCFKQQVWPRKSESAKHRLWPRKFLRTNADNCQGDRQMLQKHWKRISLMLLTAACLLHLADEARLACLRAKYGHDIQLQFADACFTARENGYRLERDALLAMHANPDAFHRVIQASRGADGGSAYDFYLLVPLVSEFWSESDLLGLLQSMPAHDRDRACMLIFGCEDYEAEFVPPRYRLPRCFKVWDNCRGDFDKWRRNSTDSVSA